MTPETELDQLKRPQTALRVYSEYLQLARQGREWVAKCCFHDDSTPSLHLFEDGGFLIYKCFGCPARGNILQFVQNYAKVGFDEAVTKIKSSLGWSDGKKQVEQTFSKLGGEESKSVLTFSLSRIQQAEDALSASPLAIEWLRGRGITLETARRFHLGFVQSAAAVSPRHEFVNSGWILFPYLDGETITLLKYRSVQGKKTPSGESGIIRKSDMATGLFNLDAVQPFDDIFVTEGEMDCCILVQAGFPSVGLPSAGFTPTPEMRDRLLQANTIYLAGDSDQPGQDTMHKLWSELRDRTFLLKWPEGIKDANECFLKTCGGDVAKFRGVIEAMKQKAHESPMPFMHDLIETIRNADDTKPMENPRRLHFEWPDVDSWCAVVPGDVMTLFATETKTGKTSWIMNVLLHNALRYGQVVVNYSAELSPDQYARRAIAYLTGKDRDRLAKADFENAVMQLQNSGAKFYNGYRPKANYLEVIELLTWAKRRLGADILVLDHLHFLTRFAKDEIKAQSEAMRMLKDLAWEYNCIVIVVGQPRKPKADHRGREAVTQDAKGSESFGSDASQNFILHRDRIADGQDGEPVFSDITKVKLDTAREGQGRTSRLLFLGRECRFVNMTTRQENV